MPTPHETADYVKAQAGELAAMCRASGLETLAHLLEIAKLEAMLQVEESLKASAATVSAAAVRRERHPETKRTR